MDSPSALSLAACITQFIDFGSKLVSHTTEIVEASSTMTIQHLSNITSDLTKINPILEKKLGEIGGSAAVLTEEQVADQRHFMFVVFSLLLTNRPFENLARNVMKLPKSFLTA